MKGSKYPFVVGVIMLLMSMFSGCGSKGSGDTAAQAAPGGQTPSAQPAVKAAPPIEPEFAGSFYPGSADKLRRDVRGYIDAAPLFTEQRAWAWVAPHAGYVYSGPIAGYVYRQIEKIAPKRVVVIAFSHRPWSPDGRLRNAGIATTSAPAFRTPLGDIAVDVDETAALVKDAKFITDDSALFSGEHSLEVQLPFVQVAAPGAKLVPLMFGNQEDPAVVEGLASLLAKRYAADPATVVVVSTDMSHYLQYDAAVEIDSLMLKNVVDLKADAIGPCPAAPHGGFCGSSLVQALIKAQKKLDWPKPVVLNYRNSGDTAGDRRKVVGYGAVQFPRAEGARPHDNELTVAQKRELLRIARTTVETLVSTGKVPDFQVTDPVLLAPGAAFVTLKIDGDLRGCIGQTEARMPLWECVREMAVAAATEDPRFRPVQSPELKLLDYEISVLFPAVPVKDINEIVIGRDGLTIFLRGRRGLLLPQVPVEWNWNLEEFLNHTANKAGLPWDAWKDPAAVLKRFEGIIFNESDVAGKE